MTRILGFIVGTRPELALRSRWWHRLAVVMYSTLVAIAGVVGASARGNLKPQSLDADQRAVVTDLYSFTAAFRGAGQPAAAFDAVDGWIGFSSDGGGPNWFDVIAAMEHGQFVCKAGGRVFGALDGATNVVAATPDELGIKIEPMPNRSGDKPDLISSVCWGPSPFSTVPASSITKYRASASATVLWWSASVVFGVAAACGVAFLLALCYYRGLIFVAFGARVRGV